MEQEKISLFRWTRTRVGLLVLSFAAISTVAAAQKDRLDPLSTDWGYQFNASATDVSSAINSGFRLIDLDVRSASPLRFDAAYVTRPGAFHYYLDVADPSTIITLAAQNGARPVDIERYLVEDSPRWTVVMDVSPRGYIFRANDTFSSLSAWVTENPGWRMIDIERSEEKARFHTLFYPNEGLDYSPWWWLVGVSGQTMIDFANSNNARVFDVERTAADSYDALFVGNNGATAWYVLGGENSATLGDTAVALGTRIVDIDYYPGTNTSTVVLLENSLLFLDGFESGDLSLWR